MIFNCRMIKKRFTSGEVFCFWYNFNVYITNDNKYKLLRLRLYWLHSCLYKLIFRYINVSFPSIVFISIRKSINSNKISFRWCNARRLKKFKAAIAAPPTTMAKVFGNGKFREKPWLIALFDDLEDGDKLRQLLQIKTTSKVSIQKLAPRNSQHAYPPCLIR